ncbi:hypothetical protein H7849_13515 [Alloacidobacterium dinghuense]|uniref:Uncharacterized protein n=1 Tax=Alloacidobacterium dinghuense TaxID=2763107 RepID=A0A7G8BCD9_9BACT|nr:hypothetical protein [Alloacidobacterium dinghuense]QNI30209.1 hypothetical protein H7849_13515 [Alloacidobacterium dinghuense]
MGLGPISVRLMVAVLLCCLFAQTPDVAQTQAAPKTTTAKKSEQSAELAALTQQIQDLTTSVPPELAAYALLRLVEAKAVSRQEQQRQLIEQAYMLAGQSPYAVRLTASGGLSDSRAGYLSQALTQGLDSLSLRTRAVTAMLKLDPERARDLYQQLRPLALANRSCADAMLYDPSAYYRSAGNVFKRGFTPEEQAKGLPDDFLESIFRDVHHASEVGSASELLRAQQFDAEMLARAEGAFARSLSGIRGDYRSFAATQNDLTRNVTRLAQVPGRASHALLEATKAYLIANDSGAVCGDQSGSVNGATPTSSSFIALNQVLVRYGIAPISDGDVKPGSVVPASESSTQTYWQSPNAKQLQGSVRALRSGDKDSPQWQDSASSTLTSLREWIDSGSEPSEEDFYIEKAVLYSQMLVTTPTDASIYDEMLNEYIAFLSEPPPSDEVRIYWLWSIQNLMQRIRLNRANGEAARAKLETAIQDAPSPSIALYGYLLELERVQRANTGRGFTARQ